MSARHWEVLVIVGGNSAGPCLEYVSRCFDDRHEAAAYALAWSMIDATYGLQRDIEYVVRAVGERTGADL